MNKFLAAIALSAFLAPANAQSITGRVTNVETTYLPRGFAIQLDTSGCDWLWYGWDNTEYSRDKDNVLFNGASLVGARFTGYFVTVRVTNGTCWIENIHVGQ